MIKKLLKYSFILFLTSLGVYILAFHFKTYRVNKSNLLLTSYEANNAYQEKYSVNNYVDEGFEAYPFFRKFITGSMYEYENVTDYNSKISAFIYLIQNFFVSEYNFTSISKELQYVEPKLIKLNEKTCDVYSDDNYVCIYEYDGYLEDNSEKKGKVEIFANGSSNLVISFMNDEDKIDEDLARMLVDDSNSEMLVYLIIEQTQIINETNMEPNEAATYFYGSPIEKLAGSISYHALIAYVLVHEDIQSKDILYEKVQEVNITQEDSDDFYVNRTY